MAEINGVKAEANLSFNKNDKISKSKEKTVIKKVDGNVSNNSETYNVGQININTGLSSEQVSMIVKTEVDNKFKKMSEAFSEKNKKQIEEAVKKIHPTILIEKWNEDLIEQQVEAYFSDSTQVSIRNKIDVLSKMTKQNYDLYLIIKSIIHLYNDLMRTWHLPNKHLHPTERVFRIVNDHINIISGLCLEYNSKYGIPDYDELIYLERIGLIYRDGETRISFKEMIMKSFPDVLLSKQELNEYTKDVSPPNYFQSSRDRWTRIFYSRESKEINSLILRVKVLIDFIPIRSYEERDKYLNLYWLSYNIL